jgi:hypothetical protein
MQFNLVRKWKLQSLMFKGCNDVKGKQHNNKVGENGN